MSLLLRVEYTCVLIYVLPTFRKECEKQVKGFKGPQFKKFNTREEAEEFIQQKSGGIVDKRKKTEAVDSKKEGKTILMLLFRCSYLITLLVYCNTDGLIICM